MSKKNDKFSIFTLIKIVLICFHLNLTQVSGSCPELSTDPELSCWTSCSFGNCGLQNIDTHAFLKCSWIVPNDNVNRTYELYIYFDNDPKKICSYTSKCDNVEKDNGVTGLCIGTIPYSSCVYMKNTKRITPALIVYDENGFELCVDTATPHSLCEIAKPDPPIIVGVSKKQQSQELIVDIVNPPCVEENSISLYYEINYVRFDGETVEDFPSVQESRTPFMVYKEASEYNFTIRSTVESYVYSDPVTNYTVTEPETAIEVGSMAFYCGQGANGVFDLDLSWKKIGVVDYFEVQVIRIISTELTVVEQTDEVPKTFSTQVYYSTVLNELKSLINYEITIVATNEGGQSPVHTISFIDDMCAPAADLSCRVRNTGKTWIEVGWDPVEMFPNLLCGYSVELIDGQDARIPLGLLNPDQHSWNQTKLEQCILYKFIICSECNDVSMSCCSVSHYADELAAPKASPDFEVSEVKHDYFTISVNENSINETMACGVINGYSVNYTPAYARDEDAISHENSLFSKEQKVVVPGLTPNTEYSFQIAAVNNGGTGVMSTLQSITTEQAAPSDAPHLDPAPKIFGSKLEVSWTPPETPNGIVALYKLRVGIRPELSDLNPNCTYVVGPSVLDCNYNGSVFSTVLNLSHAYNVTIRACTGNGSLCSSWSQPSAVQEYPTGSSAVGVILLCVFCAITVLMVLGMVVLQKFRSSGQKVVEPKVHPSILKEFSTNIEEEKKCESDFSRSRQIKSSTYKYTEIAETDASEEEGVEGNRLWNSTNSEVFEQMLSNTQSAIGSPEI